MHYELCLEYGCFPVKAIPNDYRQPLAIPDFLKNDSEMLARLNQINEIFQSLFHTVECKFDYMGGQYPDRIAQIKALYPALAHDLQAKYGHEIQLTIEDLMI